MAIVDAASASVASAAIPDTVCSPRVKLMYATHPTDTMATKGTRAHMGQMVKFTMSAGTHTDQHAVRSSRALSINLRVAGETHARVDTHAHK